MLDFLLLLSLIPLAGVSVLLLAVFSEQPHLEMYFSCTLLGYPESVSDEYSSQLVLDNDAMCCMDAFGEFYSLQYFLLLCSSVALHSVVLGHAVSLHHSIMVEITSPSVFSLLKLIKT